MTTAKLFTNGRSQAVRIPKDFAFKGISEVSVRKEGDKLILEPIRKSWTSLAAAGNADQDFMTDRPDLMDVERVKF
ncbi:MAG: antitoxin [Roseibium sp.]|uniref:antitoxin n=1 Tax=Roseibium sp. TaxID=1936156 RepID=UPI002636B002|nr:type II toxin-antitoxin system VapB family antitoxin [Roseibium sp.]MCV0428094.1 antitoxin [Roseibium sp.]